MTQSLRTHTSSCRFSNLMSNSHSKCSLRERAVDRCEPQDVVQHKAVDAESRWCGEWWWWLVVRFSNLASFSQSRLHKLLLTNGIRSRCPCEALLQHNDPQLGAAFLM